MSTVVSECNGFSQVFIQMKSACKGAGNLHDFERMSQAGSVVISLRGKEDLCFELQTAKRLAVDDPIPVALILRPKGTGRNRLIPACALSGTGGPGGKQNLFLLFLPFPDCHRKVTPFSISLTGPTHCNNTT